MSSKSKNTRKAKPTDNSATLAELLNVGDTFDYNGVTYRFKELTYNRQCEFSQWMKNNAKAEIDRSIDISDETKETMLSVLQQDFAAKKYEYHSKLCVEASRTPEGAAYLLYLGLKDEHPTIEPHEVRAMYFEKLNRIAGDIMRIIVKDPKVLSPTIFGHSKTSSRSYAKKPAKRRKR